MFFSSQPRRPRTATPQRIGFLFGVLVCSSLSSGVPDVLSAQQRRAMTVDDVIDFAQVSAPRISPDGRRVLYTVSELGKWTDNKRVTSIWMADADGSNARRFLAHEKDRVPAWSPDGRAGAFVAPRDPAGHGKERDKPNAQIWIIPVDGGE